MHTAGLRPYKQPCQLADYLGAVGRRAPNHHRLGRRYVQHIKTQLPPYGTQSDSGDKSTLIQTARYLLACQCYIDLNPVHAAMVDHLPTNAGLAIGTTNGFVLCLPMGNLLL